MRIEGNGIEEGNLQALRYAWLTARQVINCRLEIVPVILVLDSAEYRTRIETRFNRDASLYVSYCCLPRTPDLKSKFNPFRFHLFYSHLTFAQNMEPTHTRGTVSYVHGTHEE